MKNYEKPLVQYVAMLEEDVVTMSGDNDGNVHDSWLAAFDVGSELNIS